MRADITPRGASVKGSCSKKLVRFADSRNPRREPRMRGPSLLDIGEVRATEHGPLRVIERWLQPQHCHGRVAVSGALAADAQALAQLAFEPALRDADLSRLLILDTETTGLDVKRDRVVSIAALPLHGPRAYKARALDLLVNPGMPIPPKSSLIHGITDAMVGTAPGFGDVAAELIPLVAGRVLVGHNVGFDAAMLRREAVLAGVRWPEPPTLCLTQIEALLAPEGADLSLDAMAARRGIDIHGRHTALGDVLVSAEILLHMLPELAARGVTTYGAAAEFASRAAAVIRDQRAAGWFADAPAP